MVRASDDLNGVRTDQALAAARANGGCSAAARRGSSGADAAGDGVAGGGSFAEGADDSAGPLDLALFRTPMFMMNAFKVTECPKRTPHDWKACPFAHPGEKGRRRPLNRFDYNAVMCAYVRRGQPCSRGDRCNKSHNVFELWCHPQRYRSQMCVDGERCNRKVCFFAHTASEMRPATYPNAGAPQDPLPASLGDDDTSPRFPTSVGGGAAPEQQQRGPSGPPGLEAPESPPTQQQQQQQPVVPTGSWGGAVAEQQGQSAMLSGAMGSQPFAMQQLEAMMAAMMMMQGMNTPPFPSFEGIGLPSMTAGLQGQSAGAGSGNKPAGTQPFDCWGANMLPVGTQLPLPALPQLAAAAGLAGWHPLAGGFGAPAALPMGPQGAPAPQLPAAGGGMLFGALQNEQQQGMMPQLLQQTALEQQALFSAYHGQQLMLPQGPAAAAAAPSLQMPLLPAQDTQPQAQLQIPTSLALFPGPLA